MRTLYLIAAMTLCYSESGYGQALRYDSVSYTTSSSCVSGKQCQVLALPGTRVSVCQGSQPSLSACQASPATTYTSASASVTCGNGVQLTPATGGACIGTADAQGNFGFWTLPGSYSYYLVVPATAGGGTYGPYPFSVHGDSGGYTYDANYQTLADACTAAGTGTLVISKPWNSIASVDYSATCPMMFFGAGKLQGASGQTIKFQVQSAPLTTICDISAGGACGIVSSYGGEIYPEWFGGASSATSSDISTKVQAAFAASHIIQADVVFPRPSSYWFKNVVTGSNVTERCVGSTLRMPTGYGINDFILANSVLGLGSTNTNIGRGCTFQGDRASYSGGAGDGNNMAVLFNGASNAEFHGIYDGFHTDAIYLGCSGASADTPGNNIIIGSDVKISSSRRNNISIICGTNVFLDNPYLARAGETVGQVGIAPFTSIDIEPNTALNVIQGITGSFTSISPVRNHLAIAEQFTDRPDIGIDLNCNSCTGAGLSGSIVTDFGTNHIVGGWRLTGNYSNNGTSGAGNASILVGSSYMTRGTISGEFHEANAGTVAFAIADGATSISVGDGHYGGATYDYFLGSASAPTARLSTAAKMSHSDATAFNPSGVQFLAGVTGTWTPVLSFGGSSVGVTGTITGTYFTVGHVVTATARVTLTSNGAGVGAAVITGLPFAAGSDSTGAIYPISGFSALNSVPLCRVANGGGGFFLAMLNSNTGGGTALQGLLDTNITDTADFVVTLVYGR